MINTLCQIYFGIGYTEFYSLHCNFCKEHDRIEPGVETVFQADNCFSFSRNDILVLLSYGHRGLPFQVNKFMLKMTVEYILTTEFFLACSNCVKFDKIGFPSHFDNMCFLVTFNLLFRICVL